MASAASRHRSFSRYAPQAPKRGLGPYGFQSLTEEAARKSAAESAGKGRRVVCRKGGKDARALSPATTI